MSQVPVCAIHYHPDAYKADRPGVKGRHAAGAGFLSGFFRHGRGSQLVCVTRDSRHAEDFKTLAARSDEQRRTVKHRRGMLSGEKDAECLLIPGPNFDEFAWERRARNQRAYSICGVTHTLSSDRIIAALSNYLLLPVQPWDALVCTSTVAREVVNNTLENYAEYLALRTGVRPRTDLQLPIIPLGVDASRYEADQDARRQLRERIGASEADFVILFLGRFTFHAKAHPIPMYMAAERLARRLPDKKVHLVMAGQAPSESIMNMYRQSAVESMEKAAIHFVDGRDDGLVHAAWQGADVFLSLSDNIQETFGLTPIEAMAAGLPAVVSDWDGYKDTIVDGETGFRVPTHAPAPGDGLEYALRYQLGADDYDHFIGRACMSTSCDLDATVDALERLATDAGLCRKIGEAGRKRARETYDWSAIIASYEDLWLELRDLRQNAPEVAPRSAQEAANPLYPDPFAIFKGHPSDVVGPDTTVFLSDPDASSRVADLLRPSMSRFSSEFMLDQDQILAFLSYLEISGGLTVTEIVARLGPVSRASLHRTLPWLSKFGVIRLSN